METVYKACTIAGAAARGGAGIQADLKTFQELGVYGFTAITAINATNPKTEKSLFIQSVEAIEAQLVAINEQDDLDALKTGMLFSKEIIEFVADWLPTASVKHIVVDPVMFGKYGSSLLAEDAMDALKTELIPQASVITPNMPEASYLLDGKEIHTLDDLKDAARDLIHLGPKYVLVKGGRLEGPAIDILYDGNKMFQLEAPRIDTIHTNGAGCSYSAAITAELAKGRSIEEAVFIAKKFVTAGIRRFIPFELAPGMIDHRAYKVYGEDGVTMIEV